jgi:transposase InsO family protein
MKFQFIEHHQGVFSIRCMCEALAVSPSGYYAWRNRPECRRKREDGRLLVEIKAIHRENLGAYGSPRIHAELKDRQMHHGRKRVARLMRENGIRAKQKKKFKATTDSKHSYPVAPNLLQRNFETDMPNRKWLADITYIHTREGWLYLAAILDLYSKLIVGWSMASRMNKWLVLEALAMAVEHRKPGPGLIHHSDRGSQYACGDYQRALCSHDVICSMSKKGDCWDNAPMESFFHTLKTELVHHRDYQTRNQAKADIFKYIEVFYNRSRRHSALGYLAPAKYELLKMAA